MSVTKEQMEQKERRRPATIEAAQADRKGLTIGSVCRQLRAEFTDISISKIRYLEDQGLIRPHRTPGGYRLYSSDDVDRLRTILRVQRDMFLPLRVIKRELASGQIKVEAASQGAGQEATDGRDFSFEEIVSSTGIDAKLMRELEEYGIVQGKARDGSHYYSSNDREIVEAVTELARHGVAGRNLRVFRNCADKEAALLEQILAPTLRSRNSKRRKQATEMVDTLSAVASRLNHLLLKRNLRS